MLTISSRPSAQASLQRGSASVTSLDTLLRHSAQDTLPRHELNVRGDRFARRDDHHPIEACAQRLGGGISGFGVVGVEQHRGAGLSAGKPQRLPP